MINEVKKDLMQVSGLNSGVLLVSLTDIEIVLKILLLVITIVYTFERWRIARKNGKR